MCDQVNGRLQSIKKFGAPKDMNTSFATIIHAAPKLEVKELIEVRKQLSAILSPEFVRECDKNYDLINPVVSVLYLALIKLIGLGCSKHRLPEA